MEFKQSGQAFDRVPEDYSHLFNISLTQHDSSGLLDWHPFDDLCGFVSTTLQYVSAND